MPCSCWYNPSEENKKYIKDLCVLIVDRVKFLNKDAGAYGCELSDVHNLIDHLYSGKCDEKPNIIHEEWGGELRCITSDGRNVNVAEELNRLYREKNHLYTWECDEKPNEESSFSCSKCKKKAKGEWRKGYSDQGIFICNDCLGKGNPS